MNQYILIVMALILVYLIYNLISNKNMDSDGDSDGDGANTNTTKKEDFIRSRRKRKPTRLSHIALIPGLSPLEYPWDRDLLQGVFKYDYFQKKDCSNNIWFPPYYPWYPTFNKTPISL